MEARMRDADEIRQQAQAALEREPRVNPHRSPIEITIEGPCATLTGEMAGIDGKRRAVECVRAIAGVERVVDRLRVAPGEALGDNAIRDKLCGYLLDEPVYKRMAIACRSAGGQETLSRRPDEPEGRIEIAIADGIVTLRGEVLSLSHRRLAAVLAWWVPGVRDVINEIGINPPEDDNDGEISDAIELVLDKDPVIHAGQIARHVRNGQVLLRGLVTTEEEKRMAEEDVWYVEGVRDVVNELIVQPAPAGHEPLRAGPAPIA
jgi:osmotically-inducible protein OsmY